MCHGSDRGTRSRLVARLEELRPAVEEARKIEAALAALAGDGRRPAPMTVLDTLKPVPDESADHPEHADDAG